MILRNEILSWLQMKPDVHLKSTSVPDTQWERSSCCICRWSQFLPLPMMHSLTSQVPWIFPGGRGNRTYNHCSITWVKEVFSKKCNVITLNLTLIYLKYTVICLNLLWLVKRKKTSSVFLPLCRVRYRPGVYPGWGFGGQVHGGKTSRRSLFAASAGRSPAGSARSLASESSHPRGWPW